MNNLRGRENDIGLLFDHRSSFPIALLAALAVEICLVLLAINVIPQRELVSSHPQVTRIRMLAAPKPKPLPPPPKPVAPPPPPKALPPPPKQVAPPPLPPPPVPVAQPKPPPPRPRKVVKRHRVVHRIVHRTKPVPPQPAPPRPQPQPQPARVSAAARENALQAYAAMVHRVVQSSLKVPEMVEMMHLAGVAELELMVGPDGRLLGEHVLHSSGAPPIDRAALAAVKAARLPKFTPKMPNHPITVEIAIRLKGD